MKGAQRRNSGEIRKILNSSRRQPNEDVSGWIHESTAQRENLGLNLGAVRV